MTKITIREPIWKSRSIGIAEDKMTSRLLAIEITYITKDGKRLYPNILYIDREKASKYPIQLWKGYKLYIIPIADLEVIEEVVGCGKGESRVYQD